MKTKDIVYIALFAAMTAVLGLFPPITLPFIMIPITAQSMGPMLAGALIGAKRGGLALLLFCLLVAVGMPILSGGRGGLSVFMGPTAGYLCAWPIAACLIGIGYDCFKKPIARWAEVIVLVAGGVLVIYTSGISWLVLVHQAPLKETLIASLIFIPGDLIKVIVVIMIRRVVDRAYPLS